MDPFDPNGLDLSEPEYRIYDHTLERWASVDYVDYVWAIQWCWHANKPHPRRKGKKTYFCRQTSWGPRGQRKLAGPGKGKLFLHIEIAKRAKLRKPSSLHCWVDHKDGDELNCRRFNLQYATPKQNRKGTKSVGRKGNVKVEPAADVGADGPDGLPGRAPGLHEVQPRDARAR